MRKNNIIELIPSNPCFEIWYKAHFTDSIKSYVNNKELIRDLNNLIPNYKKNMDVYPLLYDKMDIAIKNSIKMEEYHNKSGIGIYDVKANPSTRVYKVVENLIEK